MLGNKDMRVTHCHNPTSWSSEFIGKQTGKQGTLPACPALGNQDCFLGVVRHGFKQKTMAHRELSEGEEGAQSVLGKDMLSKKLKV